MLAIGHENATFSSALELPRSRLIAFWHIARRSWLAVYMVYPYTHDLLYDL